MTAFTERYLAAALRGIPDKQKPDVERELRSSIADALEDRVAAGEDQARAERAVLEGMGDPARLAAGMTGRPLYLIGPELFLVYRQVVVMLLTIVVPIVAAIDVALGVYSGEDWVGALVQGAVGAFTVAVQIFFWVTLVFALLERYDSTREARREITGGAWTVDRLPPLTGTISASDTVGEVITSLITIGFLVVLGNIGWFADSQGEPIPLFNPDLWAFWLPALVIVLAILAGIHVLVFLRGRWTMPIAAVYTVLELAFAVPVVWLALSGTLINQAFAEALGWPELAEGTGWVMLLVAVSTVLVTGWEIVDAWRRARRSTATLAASQATVQTPGG
jgi:hypothetical protein